ncbi:TetR/AcrR family transcriptional regulator [Humibacter sp.]|jgi:AcrR family transcriptional regulator|uniref:TetR/AcrR family transcriptional regulator n=1 Tax=Humibacter sp. TaxID=1940291 RepID=UPI002B858402|nr:TetR/AcrR family transcriptional regulator [Humibacter sp.]HVX09135.1 TetR/AcrR family transcriptional regulator [Humibacter sp.]
MPRPRFHSLSAARQEAILSAALEEFSTHGFVDASLNRIITAAGASKGSLYYYFDGKEDLYGHLLRVQVELMIADAGPFPVPANSDPDTFWSVIENHCVRLVQALEASPQLARLLRDWMSSTGRKGLERTQQDAERTALPWLAQVLAAGQTARAIRTDVPDALLLAVGTAIAGVIDYSILTGSTDPLAQSTAVHTIIEMLRRAIQP